MSEPSKPIINLITRTSNRPNYFDLCYQSVTGAARVATGVQIEYWTTSDDDATFNYLENYDNLRIVRIPKRPRRKNMNHFPYNHYLTQVLNLIENDGWVLILDDDHSLASPDSLTKIATVLEKEDYNQQNLYLWQVKMPNGEVLPMKESLESGQISLDEVVFSCFMFHVSLRDQIKFEPKTHGEYDLLQTLLGQLKRVPIYETLVKVNGLGGGNRQDCQSHNIMREQLPLSSNEVEPDCGSDPAWQESEVEEEQKPVLESTADLRVATLQPEMNHAECSAESDTGLGAESDAEVSAKSSSDDEPDAKSSSGENDHHELVSPELAENSGVAPPVRIPIKLTEKAKTRICLKNKHEELAAESTNVRPQISSLEENGTIVEEQVVSSPKSLEENGTIIEELVVSSPKAVGDNVKELVAPLHPPSEQAAAVTNVPSSSNEETIVEEEVSHGVTFEKREYWDDTIPQPTCVNYGPQSETCVSDTPPMSATLIPLDPPVSKAAILEPTFPEQPKTKDSDYEVIKVEDSFEDDGNEVNHNHNHPDIQENRSHAVNNKVNFNDRGPTNEGGDNEESRVLIVNDEIIDLLANLTRDLRELKEEVNRFRHQENQQYSYLRGLVNKISLATEKAVSSKLSQGEAPREGVTEKKEKRQTTANPDPGRGSGSVAKVDKGASQDPGASQDLVTNPDLRADADPAADAGTAPCHGSEGERNMSAGLLEKCYLVGNKPKPEDDELMVLGDCQFLPKKGRKFNAILREIVNDARSQGFRQIGVFLTDETVFNKKIASVLPKILETSPPNCGIIGFCHKILPIQTKEWAKYDPDPDDYALLYDDITEITPEKISEHWRYHGLMDMRPPFIKAERSPCGIEAKYGFILTESALEGLADVLNGSNKGVLNREDALKDYQRLNGPGYYCIPNLSILKEANTKRTLKLCHANRWHANFFLKGT